MTAPADEKPGGKGRPTPKRRDAERRRKAASAPKTRKEAARLQREQSREKRAQARKAMQSGDDRYLPRRDAGPARAFIRNYVDSRRHAASYFLPFALMVLVFGASPVTALRVAANSLLLAGLLVVVMDGYRLGRRVLAEVETRFPGEETRGLRFYAVSRALQIRRLRMPKPKVKIGDPV